MIFWNSDILEDTQGLDILGIRAFDQGIEADLVNGITTVSARGRYFSILPWAINEFYKRTLDVNGQFSPQELNAYLTRVEFTINAACRAGPPGQAGGAVLGSDVFAAELNAIQAGEAVAIPTSQNSRILNIYYNPCKGIGLLDDGASNESIPYRLTDRGRAMWFARQKKLDGSPILDLLFHGGELNREIAHQVVDGFSLGSLHQVSEEAALLREAFATPWEAAKTHKATVDARYRRFSQTRDWIDSWSDERPISANRILAKNLAACSRSARSDEASVAWAHYEWRRRLHFALELLLSSVCGILEFGETDADGIVEAVEADARRDDSLEDLWPASRAAWLGSAKDAVQSVPKDLMMDAALPFQRYNQLRASQKMLGAFALIASLDSQTRPFRDFASTAPAKNTSDRALTLVTTAGEMPFKTLLRDLIQSCAIIPHLQVTLRKMANNQKCSLRFFPDGNVLRLTANQSGAGFSGSRLDNTIGILIDIGVFQRGADGAITATEVV